MGRSLLARWQNFLPPPEAFNVGEFVGHLQQDVVPHSALTMFHLLYQPTARHPDRPPALVVTENTLFLFLLQFPSLLWLLLHGPYVFRAFLAEE